MPDSLLADIEKAETKRSKQSQKADTKAKAGATKAKKPTRAKKLKIPEVTPDMLPENHICVVETSQYEEFFRSIRGDVEAGYPIAFDVETKTYLDDPLPKYDTVIGINFWTQTGGDRAWYLPWGHETDEKQLDRDYILSPLKTVFESPSVRWIGHNVGYDYQTSKESLGINVANLWFDTMIASQLLNENDRAALKILAAKYLGRDDAETYQKLFGKTKFSDVPLLVATWYACKDAELTYKLYEFQNSNFQKPGLEKVAKVFWDIEMPLVRVVADMELNGFDLDEDYLRNDVGVPLKEQIDKLNVDMRRAFGVDDSFNFNSTPQLKKLLFTDLKLPMMGGKGSTNAKILQKLADKHEGVRLLLEYRKVKKLYGTYVEGMLSRAVDGRLYPSFNQMGAGTGRFSSSNPNYR